MSEPPNQPHALGDARTPEHLFREASLRGESFGPIKKLPGFKKSHHVPEDHFPAAETFVRNIGHEEVAELATRLHEGIRTTFGFKRKEILYDCADGTAVIKTPSFDVNLSMDQDPEDAGQYVLVTEVAHIGRPEVVMGDGFCRLFSPWCNRLVITFSDRVSVEDKIDEIEDLPELEPHLSYEPDGSSLTLKLPPPGLHVFLDADQMILRLPGSRDLKALLSEAGSMLALLRECR